jgi:hypothetical protein
VPEIPDRRVNSLPQYFDVVRDLAEALKTGEPPAAIAEERACSRIRATSGGVALSTRP